MTEVISLNDKSECASNFHLPTDGGRSGSSKQCFMRKQLQANKRYTFLVFSSLIINDKNAAFDVLVINWAELHQRKNEL